LNLLGLADTPQRSVPAPQRVGRVGTILAPDEETDPMRRRTLLAGLTSLTGTAALGASPRSLATGNPVSALENALLDPPGSGGIPVAVPRLRQDVAAVRSVFQHGRYTEVATRLPGLLSTTMATRAAGASTGDIATANGLLADLYTLAAELTVKLGNDQLAWTTADRALQAAYSTDDILTQAAAS